MYAIKKILKNKKYKNSIFANNSEAFDASKNEELFAGHTKLSK
jgi:hypothetical protein